MPCHSDHMNPTQAESESRNLAQLLCYVLPILSRPIPDGIKGAAETCYGRPDLLDEMTEMLCSACKGMTPDLQSVFIYNGRNKTARRLADWWDTHQELDHKRQMELDSCYITIKALTIGLTVDGSIESTLQITQQIAANAERIIALK